MDPFERFLFEEEDREEKRARRKRLLWLLGLSLLILAALSLWGNRSLVHLYQLNRSKGELQAEIQRLQETIETLAQEAQALKTQPERLEEIAREDFGLAKPGEVIYQFSPPREGHRPTREGGAGR